MTSVPSSELRDRIAAALEREDALKWGYDHGFSAKYADCEETAAFVDAVLAEVQPELDRLRAGAVEREALLTEARDALEAAGQSGAHGDDWPAVAPAIRALAADRDRLRQHVDELQEKVMSFDGNGKCCCSFDGPGDVCLVHSPTITRLRAELEQARQQTAAVLALLPADPAEDINAPFIPLRRIRAAVSGT